MRQGNNIRPASCLTVIGAFKVPCMVKGAKARIFFKEWRKKRGFNQEEAAEEMGVEQATVSRLERGKIDYTQGSLEAMARAYSCEIRDLFTDPDAPENEIEAAVKRLDARQRARAIRVLKAMAEDEAA